MMHSVVSADATGALRVSGATGFGLSMPTLAHVIDDFLSDAVS